MSSGKMPPWLQEQLMKLQQSQQNLQSIMTQKQHLGVEMAEIDKALEELKNAGDSDNVYKYAGSILIKSTKQDLVVELEEKQEMAKTRSTVLDKQEARMKDTLKDQEAKITEMMKVGQAGNTSPAGSPTPNDNPRR